MDYHVGDIVLPKMHKDDQRNNRMLTVRRISKTGKIKTVGASGRCMTFMPHQIVLVKRA